MGIKIFLLVVFFAVMVGVGIYSRRHVTSVDGFVLGGRSVGPWLTAFAYGTSYFSAVDCKHLDRDWERGSWKSSRMGCSRAKDKGHDTAPGLKDYAGFLWSEV